LREGEIHSLRNLSSANLRPLLADLLPGDLPKQALKRADLKATITLDGETLRIAGLNGNIDATRLSGQMERRAGTPARWTFGLRLGTLNVADYLPPTSKGGKSQPWRLDWMKGIDVEGPLAAERLIIFGIPHTDFSAPLRLQNGVLSADPIRARVAGGSAGAGVRAEATSGGLLGRLRYTLENVNALTLSKERGQSQLLSGTGSLDADVSGLLRSGADIPAALTGTLGFTLRNGELDAGHPGTFSSFRSLGATGTLSKGILTTRDLHLDGTLTVRGYGTINLLNWTLDYRLNVSGPGFPTLPVRYYGSLDKPQRSINAQGFLAKTFGSLGNGFLTILDRVVFAPLRFLVP
ncbi:AsmA-like C-terminal region-containing protein, partial [uncultured Bilophila sp.]